MLKDVCCPKLCCCAVDECNLVIVRLLRTPVQPAMTTVYAVLGGAALTVELFCVFTHFAHLLSLVRLQTFFFFFRAVHGHSQLALHQSFQLSL